MTIPCGLTLKFYRNLLLAGIIGPIVAISLISVDASISPWFTWTGNALSDLGVHEYSYLFNYALIFEAVLNLVFVLALRPLFKLGNGTSSGLIISGLSLGMVGIFVETYQLEHLTFALVYFIVFPVSIIMFSRTIRKKHMVQAVAGYFVALISLIAIVFGVLVDFSAIPGVTLGLAIPEMIEAVLLGSWSVYMGAWALALTSAAHKNLDSTENSTGL